MTCPARPPSRAPATPRAIHDAAPSRGSPTTRNRPTAPIAAPSNANTTSREITRASSIGWHVHDHAVDDRRAHDRAKQVQADRFGFEQPHRRGRTAESSDQHAVAPSHDAIVLDPDLENLVDLVVDLDVTERPQLFQSAVHLDCRNVA